MHTVKAVIFDLGRVLVRIDPSGEKFVRLMESMGILPAETFEKFFYAAEVRQLMTGGIDPREFYHLALERFGLTISFEEFVEGWCDLFHPVPAMREIFRETAMRYRVGLLSDTDPMHWSRILELMPWLGDIDRPTLSFEVGYLKPHPKMYAAAAANCGCEMGECLFIDDRLENVDGARYSGMPALQFISAEKLRGDLRKLKIL